MINPIVGPLKWAKMYSIDDRPRDCENCGTSLTPEIPFATGDWRGLSSKPHGCSGQFDLHVAVKNTERGRREYQNFFRVVENSMIT